MGQISLAILGAVVLYQVTVFIAFQTLDSEGKRHYVSEADLVTQILVSLNGSPASNRSEQADEIMTAAPYVRILLQQEAPALTTSRDPVLDAEINRINSHLRGGVRAFATVWPATDRQSIAALFPGGGYCLIGIDQEKKPIGLLWRWITDPEPALPLFLTRLPRALLLYLVFVTVTLIWAANAIVYPIIKLSREVKAVSLDGDYAMNISERGAEEIRELTRSVNEMHRKIFDVARHRRSALAALSHDLKTILTRLKLRAEFLKDEALGDKFRQDFDIMDKMVQRKLEFLRAEGGKSDYVQLDLSSLIEAVIDPFQDEGAEIHFHGLHGVYVENSVPDLFRVFTNVVSNAVKHAQTVTISVHCTDTTVLVEIADDGPGIPDHMKTAVFEPFVRGNPEQTLKPDGGFGLGLSIVKALLDRQGGKVVLLDNEPHGLRVKIFLPKHGGRV
jgi:signal transduction histidine kinase